MSKLPNADKAIVPIEKFSEYALNPQHPTGRHKAKVFKSALGLTAKDAETLRSKILSIVTTHEAIEEEPTTFGERFVIDFEMTTSVGTANIRCAWMIRKNEDFPRLTTCYVLKE